MPQNWELGETANLINSVIGRFNTDLLNLDKQIFSGWFYGSYLASSMGELNPYESDFLLNLCRALAIAKIGATKGNHIILVDDHRFARALIKTIKKMPFTAIYFGPSFKTQNSYFYDFFRAFGSGTKTALKHWYLGKKYKESQHLETNQNNVWFMNWATNQTYDPNYSNKGDIFFGRLCSEIEEKIKRINWIANPMSWVFSIKSISKSISKSEKKIKSFNNFITLKSILRAMFGWLIFRLSVRRKLFINGTNLSPIVTYTAHIEQTKPQIIASLLYTSIAENISLNKPSPKLMIYPYENQPWERVLIKSFRRYCPETKLIGIQHTPVANYYLSLIPSVMQCELNIIPDTLVVVGREFYLRLCKNSYPESKIQVGGFYRNPSLLTTKKPLVKIKKNPKIVLVSCPMKKSESIEMIYKTLVAVEKMIDIKVVINFHPMSSESILSGIKQQIKNSLDCNKVIFDSQSANKWLKKASILIYNSSSTVFEAASEGVPAIYLGPESSLDLDKMPGGSLLKCRSSHDLTLMLEEIAQNFSLKEKSVIHARKILSSVFSKPNPNILNQIFTRSGVI